MRLLNETQYDSRTVRAIVERVARDMDVMDARVFVNVLPMRSRSHLGVYAGRFYKHGQIVLRVNEAWRYPRDAYLYNRKAEMPKPWTCANWMDALASVAGHEFMHVRQHRSGKPMREDECEWAAFRAWKREQERRSK